jgi:hypothetical protein
MKKKIFTVVLIVFVSAAAFAQHDHHTTPKTDTTHRDHQMQMNHGDHQMSDAEMPPMSHAFSLNLPMNRNGSGTGWLPDASPMYGYMLHSKKWMYMFHGNIFLRYTNQDVSNRGNKRRF